MIYHLLMNIAALDLNLLVVFEALFVERSVTRAASRIGLSQPGMSNALARLRSIFDDRLFSRSGNLLVPTAKAIVLAGPVSDALALVRGAIEDHPRFEPTTSSVRFRILTTDYCEMAVIAPFVRVLRSLAPGVEVLVRRPNELFNLPTVELASDLVDVAVGFFPEPVPPGSGLIQARLTDEKMVALSASKRPARPLSLRQFASLPQIRVALTKDIPGMMDEILAEHGYRRNVPLSCSGFLSVPWFLPGSDLLGLVPEKLAVAVATPLKLRILQLPLEIPPMRLNVMWHERNTGHPAHKWLRLQLIQACRPDHDRLKSRR